MEIVFSYVVVWCFSMLPISILVDIGTSNIEFKNKTEKILAEISNVSVFIVPFLYYFIKYLIKINFEISLLMFLFNILYYGAGVLLNVGLMIWLYDKIFKYAVRPLRSILHEFIYVLIDFIFMRNREKIIVINTQKNKEQAWLSKNTIKKINKILEKNPDGTWKNKTSEETFCKIFGCNSYKEYLKKAINYYKKTNDKSIYDLQVEFLKDNSVDVDKLLKELQ